MRFELGIYYLTVSTWVRIGLRGDEGERTKKSSQSNRRRIKLGITICCTTTSKWVRIHSVAMKVNLSKNRYNRAGGRYLQRRYVHVVFVRRLHLGTSELSELVGGGDG